MKHALDPLLFELPFRMIVLHPRARGMRHSLGLFTPTYRRAAVLTGVIARACGALLVVALVVGEARAQGDTSAETSTGPTTQIWVNLTPGKTLSERWYLELDIEPKRQITSGEEWRNLDLTPLVELYPAKWLDLAAEATVGNTRQRDGQDSFEITPRIGARLHLLVQTVQGRKRERLPLSRLGVSTLVRLEWRNFFYSDDTPSHHEWRARVRLEGKLAINHAKLSEDRTFYVIADVEHFAPLGDDIPERYVNKARVRLGLGYRPSGATRLELLYIRDWNRRAPDAEAAEDARTFDLRAKVFF